MSKVAIPKAWICQDYYLNGNILYKVNEYVANSKGKAKLDPIPMNPMLRITNNRANLPSIYNLITHMNEFDKE